MLYRLRIECHWYMWN